MNPPVRNWKDEDAKEEYKMYTYEKPSLNFKNDGIKKQS